MKVLLVSANTATTPYPVYPLGMSMVAAAAEEAGHEVACFDFLQSGRSLSALEECLRRTEPDVVGISIRNIDNVNMVSEQRYLDSVRRVVECVRATCGALVALGGSAFSILPERVLAAVGGGYGFVGEGEQIFVHFLHEAEQGRLPPAGSILRSETWMEGGAIPSPRYNAEILAHYLESGSIASVQTKRGCPLECVYCSYPALEGRHVRPREPDRVVDDVQTLIEGHGARFIFFTDAVFNDGRGAWRRVLRRMRARNVRVPWSAFLNPSGVTAEDVALMKATGLKAAEIGTDAACDATLRGQRKPFTWREVVATNRLFTEAGVSTAHYVMFGGPGETGATVREGIANVAALQCCAVFVFLGIRILPDTALHRIAVEEGVISGDLDLLDPVYYVSPAVEAHWLRRTLAEAFAPLRHVVFPADALDETLQTLHRLGHTGTLWELIAPLPSPGSTASEQP